jgi:hypothetical protein
VATLCLNKYTFQNPPGLLDILATGSSVQHNEKRAFERASFNGLKEITHAPAIDLK